MGRRSAVSRARGGSASRTPTIAAVVTVAVLAVVVIGGILWSSGGSTEQGSGKSITPTTVQASYPVSLQGGVISAGNPQAPHTIDLYEDALCPACKAFESRTGQKITDALDAGTVHVRYHMVNLLEQRSDPPGYSTVGGNAMMCAAEHGGFPSVHASLYGDQPTEGSAGYRPQQIVDLGRAVGAGPGFAGCVTSNAHGPKVAENYAQAAQDPTVQSRSGGAVGISTPTVVLDGRKLESGSDALGPVLG